MLKDKNVKFIYLIILLIGILICIINVGYKKYISIVDIIKVENFLLNNKSEYIGVLEIKKINLKKGFYSIDNINNNVNKSIEILKKSEMPNIQNGTLIMAAHSGNGQVSHFKNLYKLVKGDIINIFYKNKKYQYKLINIYEIDKTGIIKLDKENNFTNLILITCSKKKDNKQIVYESRLIKVFDRKI